MENKNINNCDLITKKLDDKTNLSPIFKFAESRQLLKTHIV